MLYDLHVHTTNSDGKYTRLDILKKANDLKLEYLSFTDHDYISNQNSKQEYEDIYGKCNVKIINGVEFTVSDYKNMHILGYDIKDSRLIEEKLNSIRIHNVELCMRLIKKLNEYYHFDLNLEKYPNFQVSKGLIRRMIVDMGYEKSISQAGVKYTGVNSKFYEEIKALTLQEVITLVKQAHGIIVLAHPSTLGLDNNGLEQLVYKLKLMGLDGIEILNLSKTTDEQMKYYESLAYKYDLLTSCGSDFHDERQLFGVNNEKSNELIKKIVRR